MKDKHGKKRAGFDHNGAVAVDQSASPGHSQALHIGTDCKYAKELRRLQIELVKLQEWIRNEKLRVVVLFEGRDAAGRVAPLSASPSA